MALISAGCTAGDSSNDGDNDGDDAVDDDDAQDDDTWDDDDQADDDDSNDDDQDDDLCGDDDAGADDDLDLPTCAPYSFLRWFKFADDFDIYESIDEFRELAYEQTLPECTVAYDGEGEWMVNCTDWSIWGAWLDEERSFPFADGQDIFFYLRMYDDDIGLYAIWFFDTDENLVMFEVNTILNPSPIDHGIFDRTGEDIPHCSNRPKKVCRYSLDDALPPLYVTSDDWLDVYGRDESGVLFGSPFHVPAPGETALSEDGKLEVRVVHSFEGTAWTEEPSLENPEPHAYTSERTYIQALAAE